MKRFLGAAAAVLLCWFTSPSHGGQVSPAIQDEADGDEAEYQRIQSESTEMSRERDRWEREQERMKPTQLAPVPNSLLCRVTDMRLSGKPRPDLLIPNPRALNGHEILLRTSSGITGGRYYVTFSSILHHPTTGRETDRVSSSVNGVNSEYFSDKGLVTWIGGFVNSPMRGNLALKDGKWVYAEKQSTGEHEDMYLYATCTPR
ncbi:hypothetical protein IVB02_06385 [Bradyrhizobium sp. 166]|uniref:hypothetical protein n=1 Tax=Bradyrhizobium sp. 166 TaxID=2782638 RepID=UPI001FF781B7|nr:hypothetical protein [Bradyrhizobium sp. 166]MCK1601058.1 hypothetical protein [Bradyrhizobium sp. 166]